jgi:hypothetical protein
MFSGASMTHRNEVLKSTSHRSRQDHNVHNSAEIRPHARIATIFLLAAFGALTPLSSFAQTSSYVQTNIVSDGFVSAAKTDHNLINPWGIAIGKAFWIDSPGSGLSLVDDSQGSQQFTVTVPAASTSGAHGVPTGVVFNADTTVFQIPSNTAARSTARSRHGT